MSGETDRLADGDPFAALRVPALRRFILGRIAASLAGNMLAVAIGWQIYDRTNSTFALGMVGLVQVVPVVALALPVGRLVDRKNRRDMAIVATVLQCVCAIGLVLTSALHAPIPYTYAVLFGIGVASSLGGPAMSALFAQITPKHLFVNANAWRSTSFQLAATGGPALAGVVIASTGDATWTYALEAVALLAFVAVLFSLPRPPTPVPVAGGERHDARELRAGLHFVFGNELLLSAITLDLFAVLLGGATALLPVFARDQLHVGATGLGWLRAAPSLGALLMALVTTRLPPWKHAGRTLLFVVAGFGASMVVFGLSRWFWLSFLALVASGAFDNVSVVIRITIEQMVTPDALRGRVSAVHYVFVGMSNELGEFESGLTAAAIGPIASVVGGGIGTLLVVALTAYKWPALRRLGRLGDIRAVGDGVS